MKRLISLAMVLLMSLLFMLNGFAASADGDAIPFWDYTRTADISIHFNGSNAIAQAAVSRIIGYTNQIDGTLVVYKVNGSELEYIDSVADSAINTNLNLRVDFTAESGATYQAVLFFTSYGPDDYENETLTETRTCP